MARFWDIRVQKKDGNLDPEPDPDPKSVNKMSLAVVQIDVHHVQMLTEQSGKQSLRSCAQSKWRKKKIRITRLHLHSMQIQIIPLHSSNCIQVMHILLLHCLTLCFCLWCSLVSCPATTAVLCCLAMISTSLCCWCFYCCMRSSLAGCPGNHCWAWLLPLARKLDICCAAALKLSRRRCQFVSTSISIAGII